MFKYNLKVTINNGLCISLLRFIFGDQNLLSCVSTVVKYFGDQ